MPHTTVNVLVLGSRCNPEQRRWVMNEFDKHWNEWAIASNCTEDEAKIHFKAGQQSQKGEVDRLQAKIDELSKKLGYQEKAYKNVKLQFLNKEDDFNELQGRIDGALEKCYTGIRKQGGDYYLELVEAILKGKEDEN